MKTIRLTDINILDIGNVYNLAGTIWSGGGRVFLAKLPEADLDGKEPEVLEMNSEDWKKFLRQSDVLETEILRNDPDGIKKAIVRKSQRLIDDQIQWSVFKRDNYTCRYCGRDGVKLTVDHIDLWEHGGATVEENLITACRKCNKERGSMYYEVWINSEVYKKISKNLDPLTKQKNIDIIKQLSYLGSLRKLHIRSR